MMFAEIITWRWTHVGITSKSHGVENSAGELEDEF
jgi:hypothetical protein